MSNVCGDNRFKVIAEAKKDLLESTNIEMAPDEMAVLDSFLLRCWQMGWLKQYETYTFYFYDNNNSYKEPKDENHVWMKVLQTLAEMKGAVKVIEHDASVTDTDGYKYHRSEYLCSACKKKVLGGDDYCSHCGAKLDWSGNE